MQAEHTDPGIELVRVVGNVIEVVLEPGLTDELADRAWPPMDAYQALTGQQQQVARGIMLMNPSLVVLKAKPSMPADPCAPRRRPCVRTGKLRSARCMCRE